MADHGLWSSLRSADSPYVEAVIADNPELVEPTVE